MDDESTSTELFPETPENRDAIPTETDPAVSIPDHELLRCIGAGSYGMIWLARNMTGVHRAVKIIYRSKFKDRRPYERELSGIHKFEPISRSHEGFVDVLHVGINEERGYFYYVMELGDDVTLGQKIDPRNYKPLTLAWRSPRQGHFTFDDCLQLGVALSLALAELHKHGLVHRDIKPSNIIFVNGVPKLADIGLVADFDETRSFVGTEGYMPLEGPGTPQADVYSLGKVLYEVSTGKDRNQFPELPTLLDKRPDAEKFMELNAVVLQACREDPKDRYKSAWDMHAHLLLLANGKSVKRLQALELRLKNLKRAGRVAVVAAGVAVIIGFLVYQQWKDHIEALQKQVDASIAAGNRAVETGDWLGAMPYFGEILRLNRRKVGTEPTDRLRFNSVLERVPKLTRLWAERTQVGSVEFDRDGRRILVALRTGGARLYDFETGKLVGEPVPESAYLISGGLNPNGDLIATASVNGPAMIWNPLGEPHARELPDCNLTLAIQFSPDGRRLVGSCDDHLARVWDVGSGRLELKLEAHTESVLFAGFSHNGRWIVTTSRDFTAQIWDATNGLPRGERMRHKSWVHFAAFSPDDKFVATASSDHTARVWTTNGQPYSPPLHHPFGVSCVQYSPDGRLIATAGFDGIIRLWRADNFQPYEYCPIIRNGEPASCLAFSPDGRRMITGGFTKTVRIWDLAPFAPVPRATGYSVQPDGCKRLEVVNRAIPAWSNLIGTAIPEPLRGNQGLRKVETSRDGHFVIALSTAGNSTSDHTNWLAQVWSTNSILPVAPGLLLTNNASGASISSDGRRLLVYGGTNAQVWDVQTQMPFTPPMAHPEKVNIAQYSPDESTIATAAGSEVRVWNAVTGTLIFAPLGHAKDVYYLCFSPDGTRLVSCCQDNDITPLYAQIWDARTGHPIGPRLNHSDGVRCAAFSADGLRLATGCEDHTASIWNCNTGRLLVSGIAHGEWINSVAFSPDCRWLVTSSPDKTARVWNAETGDPLTLPMPHLALVSEAQFTTDGLHLITTTGGIAGVTNGWIWNLPVDNRPVDELRRLAYVISAGMTVTSTGSSTQSDSLEAIWNELRSKNPADFSVSAEQVVAWHEFIARQSEAEQDWSAAIFHWGLLSKLKPGDPDVLARLSAAEERRKNAK